MCSHLVASPLHRKQPCGDGCGKGLRAPWISPTTQKDSQGQIVLQVGFTDHVANKMATKFSSQHVFYNFKMDFGAT